MPGPHEWYVEWSVRSMLKQPRHAEPLVRSIIDEGFALAAIEVVPTDEPADADEAAPSVIVRLQHAMPPVVPVAVASKAAFGDVVIKKTSRTAAGGPPTGHATTGNNGERGQ